MLNQSHLLSLPKQRGSSVLVCDDPGSSYPTNLLSRVTWGNYRRMETQSKQLWGLCGGRQKMPLLRPLTAIQLSGANECRM